MAHGHGGPSQQCSPFPGIIPVFGVFSLFLDWYGLRKKWYGIVCLIYSVWLSFDLFCLARDPRVRKGGVFWRFGRPPKKNLGEHAGKHGSYRSAFLLQMREQLHASDEPRLRPRRAHVEACAGIVSRHGATAACGGKPVVTGQRRYSATRLAQSPVDQHE